MNHKYALLALDASAKLEGSAAAVGRALTAFHEPPLEFPEHWRGWLGSFEADRIEKCRLFLLATAFTKNADVLDEENSWLGRRLDLFYRAVTLTSVGFRVGYGLQLLGARSEARISVRQTHRIEPILPSPGVPHHFILTLGQMRQADALVSVLWDLADDGHFGRLWRAIRAFEAALHTSDLSMRLHQLVRALEGVIPIPHAKKARAGRDQRDWFADKVALTWSEPLDREKLLSMYDSRGATEHLALPVRDLQKRDPALSAADAELPFASLVFLAEGLARHVLVRVLESSHLLRTHFASEESMIAFWSQPDTDIKSVWGDRFPAADYSKMFDVEGAREGLRRSREQRDWARALMRRAPAEFRGVAPECSEEPLDGHP